jgi:hypothetical protein
MKTNGKRANKSGKTYPESSARQALRSQRRAQGGPGITTGQNPKAKGCGNCATCSCATTNVQDAEIKIESTV